MSLPPTVADLESGVAGADLLREMGGGRMQLDGRRMYAAAIAWVVPSSGKEGRHDSCRSNDSKVTEIHAV